MRDKEKLREELFKFYFIEEDRISITSLVEQIAPYQKYMGGFKKNFNKKCGMQDAYISMGVEKMKEILDKVKEFLNRDEIQQIKRKIALKRSCI